MKPFYLIIVFILFLLNSIQGQTPCVGGMAGSYPCNNVDLLSFIPLSTMSPNGSPKANDIWGWTDPSTGKEYAIVGMKDGTAFVDISDPINPVYLGRLPTATFNSSWRDMKVHNNHVFVVSEATSHGIQSFDLTTLRNVSNPPVTFSALSTFNNVGAGAIHNIVGFTEIGHMVVVGGAGTGGASGGLIFVNVSNPSNMVRTGDFASDGYTHDAICFIYQGPDTDYIGKQICIASNEDTQTIVDITNKSNPVQLSRTGYVNDGYTHQGWVSADHKYLFFNDELDEYYNIVPLTRTHVMDISDLNSPQYLGYYEFGNEAIDHNLYVKGQYSYQAHYRSGLRILNLKNFTNNPSTQITEAAFFDTYPSNDNHSFNAAWGVYPFFKSGVVLVSDIEKGLFVLKPKNIPHFVMEGDKIPQTFTAGSDIEIDINFDAYYGYSDNVTLSVSNLPAGVSVSYGTNPVSSSGFTTITLSNTGSLSGKYHLTIEARGPGNNAIHDIAIGFEVVPSPNLFVDASVGSSGSGTTWSSAFKTLNEALAAANAGEEIWVREGTYKPTTSTDRSISFIVKNEVNVYGGFDGTETERSQRDPVNNLTILSGDIGSQGIHIDNSFQVLEANNISSKTIIDGFQIADGYANEAMMNNNKGGGIYSNQSFLQFKNCDFRNNYATTGGAAFLSSSEINFINCTFNLNRSPNDGKSLYINGNSGALLDTCSIDDSSTGTAQSVYVLGSSSSLNLKGQIQIQN